MVIAGLALEVGLALLHLEAGSYWGWWGPVVADSLVAIGVMGEVLASARMTLCQGELTRRSNDRLGEAQKRAAAAELLAERLRSQFTWRRLSSAEKVALQDELSRAEGASVVITFGGDDPEASTFAHEIGSTFKLAGWAVGYTAASFGGPPVFGLIIEQPDKEEDIPACAAARNAANAAGIEYRGGATPSWFMGTGDGEPTSSPCAYIYVGPKPIPDLG